MTPLAALLAGVTLGLLSTAHCALMCGPVVSMGRSRLAYLVGRLATYAALGALAGSAGHVVLQSTWAHAIERVLALLLAALLLGKAFARRRVMIGVKPRRSPIGFVLARVADEPLLLGAATALLPCATLFAAVMAAAATGSALSGTLFMIAFAIVSGVAVVSAGSVFARLDRRVLMVALVFGSAVWLVRSASEPDATCPLHQGQAR